MNNEQFKSKIDRRQIAIALDIGYHPFKLTFFQKEGGQSLAVFIENDTFGKISLDSNIIYQTANNLNSDTN